MQFFTQPSSCVMCLLASNDSSLQTLLVFRIPSNWLENFKDQKPRITRMNATSEHLLLSETFIVSKETSHQMVKPSKEISSNFLPQTLKPKKKISKKKMKSNRRRKLR
ncbi:unnamed protein product [Vicia faba]|uniref:Uncharacterized protein n=1 Tax=Vicia faba TaxID=3906 RepID=A0AAV1A4W4_VICFA|nr:unnamed protein product [Vicia faba]